MKTAQRGVALVELALILPLLLILTFITTEFGRAMFEYNAVTKSTRDAVRYLSFQTPNSTTAITTAQNLIVYGNPMPQTGAPRLARGLTTANVDAATCCTWRLSGTSPVINTVTVQVTGYTFRPIFSSVFGARIGNANGEIVFSTISATMRAAS